MVLVLRIVFGVRVTLVFVSWMHLVVPPSIVGTFSIGYAALSVSPLVAHCGAPRSTCVLNEKQFVLSIKLPPGIS